ncbi:MAG: helix-turn-helix domain-containing protein [Lachnospiraceae bacterium]|nr:helix-turn-helix domain-containing protein [Lachnospiraceae bacterium]
MNKEEIRNRLLSWDRDELFYREYTQRILSGQPVEDLMADEEIPREWKDWISDPGCIDPNKTEDDFFREKRNVSLQKHPRFFPYFEHRHTFFEMIYVLSGKCREVTEGAKTILEEGDLFVLAPNVTHGIEVKDESVVLNILIRHNTFMDIFLNTVRDKSQIALFFLGNLYEKDKIPYLLYHTGKDERIRDHILDLAMEQSIHDEYADKISCALVTLFFHHLTRSYSCSMEIPGVIRKEQAYQNEMIRYITDHYQSVTLGELAETFHFSVPYCSRLVQEITGRSFSRLVTELRVQQGENLLSHTQMNVGDISAQVGYRNPETFIRAFTRIYRMSPSQYRRSALLAENPR